MDAPLMRVPHPGPHTRRYVERLRRTEPAAGLSFGLSADGLVLRRGQGAVVEDVDGNRFLDFVAGFGSLNAGHCHPQITAAIQRQAGLAAQAMGMAGEVRIDLAERLIDLVSAGVARDDAAGHRVLFSTSGSEAVEVALKLARRATGRQQVVAFAGGFHGRTSGALSLMGRASQWQGLGVSSPGAYHVPYPYPLRSPFGDDPDTVVDGTLGYLDACLSNPSGGWQPPAAVVVEPVQGNGGMIPAPAGFLRGLRDLCDRHGMLLVVDEVMSGFHRTGRVFAYLREEGVEPDIVVLGKSLSAGLPLAACVARAEVADASPAGTETSTYSGNLVSCASALAALEVYEQERLGERAVTLGDYFVARLGEIAGHHAIVGEVRGCGLMVAVELVADDSNRPLALAREASRRAIRHGLLIYPGGHYDNVIAYLPPLTIDESHIDIAVEITDDVLGELPGALPGELSTTEKQ